jgi:hypothetical protein
MPRCRRRQITPRRLGAAKRALAREREHRPLLAQQIASEQPTPEQRIRDHDAQANAHWQHIRDHCAATWRSARSILFALPGAEREALLDEWNRSSLPGSAGYFADFMWRKTGRRSTGTNPSTE